MTNPRQAQRSEENNFAQTDTHSFAQTDTHSHNFRSLRGKLEMFYLYKDPVLPWAAGVSEEELRLASLYLGEL